MMLTFLVLSVLISFSVLVAVALFSSSILCLAEKESISLYHIYNLSLTTRDNAIKYLRNVHKKLHFHQFFMGTS